MIISTFFRDLYILLQLTFFEVRLEVDISVVRDVELHDLGGIVRVVVYGQMVDIVLGHGREGGRVVDTTLYPYLWEQQIQQFAGFMNYIL